MLSVCICMQNVAQLSLLRPVVGSGIRSVPDEAAPLDSAGHEFWPPGWMQPAMGTATASSQAKMPDQASAAARGSAAAAVPAGKESAPHHVVAPQGAYAPAQAKRRVESEADLFALLRTPYRPPHERDCP